MTGCAGRAAATRKCGEGSRRARTERSATCESERVRAPGRAMGSAKDSASGWTGSSASFASRARHVGRCGPIARLQLDGGGPSPLAEDSQWPHRRLGDVHGTRNSVPSIAAAVAEPCPTSRSAVG
jgi:hypothetical protein